ncbi:UDP-N-acetylmuramate dehydrogenase [Psychroserpens sp.]|uniref:UDP-N-acetylmuramate dehydrogenase n=1 Tax=Psychroserpens sp. TaxID=2020870 RepID=UPI001B2A7007|nr:UDP-N-acetylmuramate dehydrogenase [Psychroserpens sp.]MBO6605961.1 UDP-N-acetylmuramate dehydrogenase [Psychroserpens sp.]MBO6652668.1 UDP-N-acetylmuramate dehydrogenase [Psychroserpens sp.]MBO6681560.1 UDP-N-acetylmuramate dehydrogenase [Psychroserpens sp.]MBO6749335.1 UDP-N-acetylmuramate dehydrogenase [Psychroserpens sp.]MBO6914219.1 UDP-N-acetylmuramate dehydrogenase [Psychroserpens sp.]
MLIQENISLKDYNTFGIDVKAKYFSSVSSVEELIELYQSKSHPNKFILGGGSNMLLTKDIEALVIHLNLKGKRAISNEQGYVLVESMAGENWHDFVLWTIEQNYGGLENLSLIPGNVGTSPIQNIGAYGVELKDTFHSCQALNLRTLELETFSNSDCNFGYRNSIFKTDAKGQYIIVSVVFKLTTEDHNLNTSYGAIASELEIMNVNTPTIREISNAVIAIRQRKLPDPNEIGNSGSFFKNPVIRIEKFQKLKENFAEIPHYPVSSSEVKVPAGWLIEYAGFKGKTFVNYGVHKNQALVLVNYGGASGSDIYKLSQLIQETIKRLFDISLEAEVNIF